MTYNPELVDTLLNVLQAQREEGERPRKPPKPIKVDRVADPALGHAAWIAEAPGHFTGQSSKRGKERARKAIEAAIISDGYDPARFDIVWITLDTGWGWTAQLKEGMVA